MKPLLKWAGGKYRLAPKIAELMPRASSIDRYIEPFVGAGGALLGLREQGQASKPVISDQCPDLIYFWKAVRDTPIDLAFAIKDLEPAQSWNQLSYYDLRELDRSIAWRLQRPLVKAARFAILNRLCFNGLCRHNLAGQFNAPWGKYNPERWNIPGEKELMALSAEIKGAVIYCRDFVQAIETAHSRDFLYLDPPYTPKYKSGFTGYFGAWGLAQELQLHEALVLADRRGVRFILSGHDEPSIRDLYCRSSIPNIRIKEINVARCISANGDRKPAKELLITNYQG